MSNSTTQSNCQHRFRVKGDATALRLVLERLIPPTRERPINLSLPKVETAQEITVAIGAVLAAVADGTISPSEGQALAGLLEAQRKSIETVEIEKRLVALETAASKPEGRT
jgi:hypothetical protein